MSSDVMVVKSGSAMIFHSEGRGAGCHSPCGNHCKSDSFGFSPCHGLQPSIVWSASVCTCRCSRHLHFAAGGLPSLESGQDLADNNHPIHRTQ